MRTASTLLLACAVATSLLASACATVHETYTPDGRKAYALNCSGTARGWDKCFSAAGDFCKEQGYDIVDRTGEDAAAIGGGPSGFLGARTTERTMVVACKR